MSLEVELHHLQTYWYNNNSAGDWKSEGDSLTLAIHISLWFPDNYMKQRNSSNTTKADTSTSLTIHRCKFYLGLSSMKFKLNRAGKDNYVSLRSKPMDAYGANNPAIQRDDIITVPIYEKNRNYTLSLESSYPGPLFLYSMVWEGDMTNNFYNRV